MNGKNNYKIKDLSKFEKTIISLVEKVKILETDLNFEKRQKQDAEHRIFSLKGELRVTKIYLAIVSISFAAITVLSIVLSLNAN